MRASPDRSDGTGRRYQRQNEANRQAETGAPMPRDVDTRGFVFHHGGE